MSGSNTWRLYVADNGEKFSIYVAKHLADIRPVGVGVNPNTLNPIMPPRDQDYPALPRGFECRYCWVHSFPRAENLSLPPIRLVISDPAYFALLPDPYSNFLSERAFGRYPAGYFVASSVIGERRICGRRIDDYQDG